MLREIIKNRIKEYGITDAEVAKATGLDPSRVSEFLSGRRDVLLGTAEKYMKALNIDYTLK